MILADAVTPDPSDGIPYKWLVACGIVGGTAIVAIVAFTANKFTDKKAELIVSLPPGYSKNANGTICGPNGIVASSSVAWAEYNSNALLPQAATASKNIKSFNGVIVVQNDSIINPNLVDSRGRSNIERMQKGLAPIGPDGKSVNLHHVNQTMNGPVEEMTATYHQKNYSLLHSNTGKDSSQINRKEFDSWRRAYWQQRANDF